MNAPQWKEFFFIEEITDIDTPRVNEDVSTFDVYNLNGQLVRKATSDTKGLEPGLYIINGKKVLIR